MPVYASECTKCGKQHEYVRSIAERNNTPRCCRKKTVRVIEAAQVGAMTWTGHKGVLVAGKWCETGSDYKRLMKQGGYIPEHEARVEAKKARQYAKEKQKKKLGKAIEKAMKGQV